jgi:eukaryotic-like serine/threonine-protein kinase
MNTTLSEPTVVPGGMIAPGKRDTFLFERYNAISQSAQILWATQYRKIRLLGKGGQGVVYLSERQGSDLFRLPVALKIFSPEGYCDSAAYEEDMARVADIASRVALIQNDNLLDLHNFISNEGIRIMIMEWVDGFDLRDLLTQNLYDRSKETLSPERWKYVTKVILAPGVTQPRLKPGVAIQILRECLAGLGALHREGIAHGDLKPANIMVKRTGNAKIIDIGSAIEMGKTYGRRMWSPTYAAPEVLRGGHNTMLSDLASLGYILIEMLAGQGPFEGLNELDKLLDAKMQLEHWLPDFLPDEVRDNELLLHLCRKLTAPDPAKRFQNAQAADLDRKGAADFHRQLVKGDLASEYETDLRNWLDELA